MTIQNSSKTLFFLLLFTIFFSCKKESETTKPEIITPEIAVRNFKKSLYKNEIDSIFKRNLFNGSIAVFQDSILLTRKESGFEDFTLKTPISENTIFAIGSISKQFTTVMILKQTEVQKLNLQDFVSKFLPEFQTPEFEKITVEQLMNHTSGITDSGNGLQSKPGEKFNYSNKGFYFLGKILEKASGKSYDETAKELFQSIGLNQTFTAENFSGNNFGGAHTGNSKNFQEIENMPKRLTGKSISVAAGGILSTINDLHLWNQKLYNGKIINSENLQKFLAQSAERAHPIFGKMGYGLGIMMTMGNPKSYFHSGYVKGSPSLNIYYPETKTSVIILSNIADETKGKTAFFKPHQEMKNFADRIEMVSK